MRKFLSMSVLMLFICLSFNLDFKTEKTSYIPEISISKLVYAQDAAPEESKVEVKESDVKVSSASDMEHHQLEIPVWVGSVVMFLQGVPKVGPILVSVLGYMGLLATLLTLLSTLLMGISGVMAQLTKGKASPKWLKDAKKWVDYLTQYAKYLSMYNVKKDDENKS